MSFSNPTTTPTKTTTPSMPVTPSNKYIDVDEHTPPELTNTEVGETSMLRSASSQISSPTTSPPNLFDFSHVNVVPKSLLSRSTADLTSPLDQIQAVPVIQSSAVSGSMSTRRPLHSVHSKWDAIFVHTARCDACDENKKPVMQRCVECSHQLCRPCMLANKWKQLHNADLSVLVWTPPSGTGKKARKAREQGGSSSIKTNKLSLSSLEIGCDTKSAAGSSRVTKSVYDKAARHAGGKRLATEEEKYAYLSSSQGAPTQDMNSYRPTQSSPLINQVLFEQNESASPLKSYQPEPETKSHLFDGKDNSDLFDDTKDSPFSGSYKPPQKRRKLRALPATKTNKVTPTRRQPLRRKSGSGELITLPNYREVEVEDNDEDEKGDDDKDTDEIPREKGHLSSSTSTRSGRSLDTNSQNHNEESFNDFRQNHRSAVHLGFRDLASIHNGAKNSGTNHEGVKSIAIGNLQEPNVFTYTPDQNKRKRGTRFASTTFAEAGEASSSGIDSASQGGVSSQLADAYLSEVKATPGDSPLPVERSAPMDFAGMIAKVMKERADNKKKEQQAEQMNALDIECKHYWNTNEHILHLRRTGDSKEAREVFEAAKALLALHRGILLDDE